MKRLSKNSANVDAAIATISQSKQTHQNWADYFEKFPEEQEKYSRTIHTREQQLGIIAEYENVLKCLQVLKLKLK